MSQYEQLGRNPTNCFTWHKNSYQGGPEVGVNPKSISCDIKIKTINANNNVDLSSILDTLEKTPKVMSNLNGYFE